VIRYAFFIVVILTSSLQAQNGSTVLSRYGIGELSLGTTIRQIGLGSVSVPVLSSYDINQANPAAWTTLRATRIQLQVSVEHTTTVLTNTDFSRMTSSIQGLQVAVPLLPKQGITFVLGFLPVSRINYKIQKTTMLDDQPAEVKYSGTGGLSLVRFGSSYRPVSWLHVGASFEYLFGSLSRDAVIDFSSANYHDTNQQLVVSHGGPRGTFGFVLSAVPGLNIGASVSTSSQISEDRTLQLSYVDRDTTLKVGTREFGIPAVFHIGATYQLGSRWMIGTEYSGQDWSATVHDNPEQYRLRNMYTIAAGIEYQPSSEQAASFIDRLAYRIGTYYRSTNVEIDGNAITETFITAGFGFPIGTYTRGDLAISYGWRGDENIPTGYDSIFRVYFSISAGELWFQTRPGDE